MAGNEPKSDDVFQVDRIRQLVELMEQHGLSEVDLRHDDQRIRLRRGISQTTVMPSMPYMPAPTMPAVPAPTAPAPPAPTGAIVAEGQRVDDDKNMVLIKSPMVGTFYGRPNPDSPSFVKVGDNVSADTTVCIIEAMKVFNEIPAEVSGKIVAVLVEEEEAVEYGKPLFKVDTSK